MGKVVDDFYDSDAPQFKGKSKEKRRQMAIAAKLSADESYTEKSMERTQRLPGKPNTLCGTGGYLKNAMKATGTKKIKNYKEDTSIIQGRTSKKKVSYRGATADHKRDKDGNIVASHYKKEKPNVVSIKKKDTRTDAQKKKHSDSVRKFDNYQKLKDKVTAKDAARKKHNQEYHARKRANEGVVLEKSDAQKRLENEKRNTERDLRMKHGKKWKDYTKDAIAAKEREKNRLKVGEVKRYDKKKQKWVSNKD